MQVQFKLQGNTLFCDLILDKGEMMPSAREIQNRASNAKRGLSGINFQLVNTPRGRAVKFTSSRDEFPSVVCNHLTNRMREAFPPHRKPTRKSSAQSYTVATGGEAARRNRG